MKTQIERLILNYEQTVIVLSSHLKYYEGRAMREQAEMEKLRIMTYKKIIHEMKEAVSSDSASEGN